MSYRITNVQSKERLRHTASGEVKYRNERILGPNAHPIKAGAVAAAATYLHYWKLDEASGDALDSGTAGLDGTIYGTVSRQAAPIPTGSSASIDFLNSGQVQLGPPYFWGPTNNERLPYRAILDADATTLEFWFNVDDVSKVSCGVYGYISTEGSGTHYVYLPNGARQYVTFQAGTGNYNVFEFPTAWQQGDDVHIAITRTNGTTRAYKNGVEAFTALTSAADFYFLTIGSYTSGSFPFPGRIDEVKVHASALTGAEVLAAYNAGVA